LSRSAIVTGHQWRPAFADEPFLSPGFLRGDMGLSGRVNSRAAGFTK
jgi:hypothetical protein